VVVAAIVAAIVTAVAVVASVIAAIASAIANGYFAVNLARQHLTVFCSEGRGACEQRRDEKEGNGAFHRVLLCGSVSIRYGASI